MHSDHKRPKIKDSLKSPHRKHKLTRAEIERKLDDEDPSEAAKYAVCDPSTSLPIVE